MPRPSKKLTQVETTYIEARMGKDSAEAIAKELGKKIEQVSDHIDQIRKKQKPKDHFAVHSSGAISMTAAQSIANDRQRSMDPANELPLTLEQMQFIEARMKTVSVSEIARQANLTPAMVEQAIHVLRSSPLDRRETYYRRNSDHLHKIDPTAPIR